MVPYEDTSIEFTVSRRLSDGTIYDIMYYVTMLYYAII